MCFVWISEQTANVALQNLKRFVSITEVDIVYCAVRIEFLYNTHVSSFQGLNACVYIYIIININDWTL